VIDAWLFPAYAITALARPLYRRPCFIAGRRRLSDYKLRFGLVERSMDRLSRAIADVTIANSEAVAQSVHVLEGIARSRICVIPNGVVTPLAIGDHDRQAIRARFAAGLDDIVIGCIANYRRGKGLIGLVEVAGRVCAARQHARFVLIGEGPLRPALAASISRLALTDRVVLHGPEPDPREVLGAFDILIQASRSEGFPNSVLEAAAAGLAIVATDAGGTREFVRDRVTGLLVEVGDLDSLEARLLELIDNRQLRMTLGENARERAIGEFSIERFVDNVAALYRDVAGLSR
jgi:glycosyltransferase involved in cell wall biosynthesis